ncbi:hypothetical protein ASU31_16975 [Pedobacter ginsenosidimutans]|uniref:Uncharacterized protein n=1 Tax=Pedobacter ginsenosidimutans TaxID=687842 RepID=A0A0T5VMB9_9SPHI|nr:hypothetical protein ASU31_16975 [Pedobacter ginsenosidimutans]
MAWIAFILIKYKFYFRVLQEFFYLTKSRNYFKAIFHFGNQVQWHLGKYSPTLHFIPIESGCSFRSGLGGTVCNTI